MTDVSIFGALLAGVVSFLSPCVLPLVPGYVSMLSGIGMEELRQGQAPRASLFGSALAFVAGFSTVFITFGASASAVGQFLRQNRGLLAPIAGALILLFGLHLIGWLAKLSFRVGAGIGILFVVLGFFATLQSGPLFAGFRAIHFFSLSIVGFLGPAMARWLNRDVHLRSKSSQTGVWSGFLLGFAFAFGWTPHRSDLGDRPRSRRRERHRGPWGAAARGLFGGTRRPISVDGSWHRPVPELL